STSKTPSYTKSVSWQHHLEICENIFRQQNELRKRIDDRLSEEIIQKCRNMKGEYVWPWILPFSVGIKHTNFRYQ
ncbi:hypothetical protein Q0S12_23965, partial [Escherichia coli O6:H49]